MSLLLVLALLALLSPAAQSSGPRRGLVTVFGATGGVGQLICSQLLGSGWRVRAVTRDPVSAASFQLLSGCELLQADARDPSSLPAAVQDADSLVISVGTTAFPTSKWRGGNTPEVACLETVANILNALPSRRSPGKIVLLSSIGVERVDQVLVFCCLSTSHALTNVL